MSSVKAPPALNVLGPTNSSSLSLEDEEMREQDAAELQIQCNSPTSAALKSPTKSGGGGKNTLGLTLPGSIGVASGGGGGGICSHSVDSIMLGGGNGHHHVLGAINLLQPPPRSPPRRIILEAEKPLLHTQQNGGDGEQAMTMNHHLLKTPPLICEQGPSAPSSPTTPSPGARSAKRPCPLSVDALQRINLLSPNYIPPYHNTMDAGKLPPPISPGYPTSDLGSSPRSSISASHYSSLGINAANWNAFRDAYARRHGAGGGSSADGEDGNGSEFTGAGGLHPDLHLLLKEGGTGGGRHSSAALLSPHQLLSPAPFSPFSDCGVADLHVASVSGTPYSSRSPNLSPSPMRRSSNLHFSFEQIRSRSSLSNHGGTGAPDNHHHLHHLSTMAIGQPRSLDMEARERSRSEGEALGTAGNNSGSGSLMEDERMDTSSGHGHSTLSVPTGSSGQITHHLHAGQKRRLLQKSRRAEEEEEGAAQQQRRSTIQGQLSNGGGGGGSISQQDSLNGPGPSASQMPSRQPTIEEPPPSPTLAELFQPGDLDKDRRRQVEDWIRQQTAALEAFRHSLIPPQQEVNLLQVPTIVPQNLLEQLWPSPSAANSQVGPIRSPTLWRRSRSESDVSAATSAAAAAAGSGGGGSATPLHGRRQSHQTQQAPKLMVPLNEATHVCEHCGQGFSMHDRLAKHIASRHRDRSSSMNDENSRVHKCTLCPKSFGRSDMLTRHMRLHTGLKPYACHLCGQVFSRSDHLSTHQRTHTGEKPYRCPQCNYTASRRDMITRHMRTHLLGEGGACAFGELQIPPINELSLNPPPPFPPSNPTMPTTHSNSQQSNPLPPTVQSVPQQPPLQPAAPPIQIPSATAATGLQNADLSSQGTLPKTVAVTAGSPPQTIPHPTTTASSLLEAAATAAGNLRNGAGMRGIEQQQQQNLPTTTTTANGAPANLLNEQIASLLSAAVANGAAAGLLGPQLMFGSLGAQLPAHLRRSTPNLLGPSDYPYASAFRPPPPLLPPSSSALDPAIAAAAAAQVQQLISQQQQRLSLPGGAGAAAGNNAAAALPFLLRQNSFGGLGFSDQQQHGGHMAHQQHQEWPK